ncbi:host attachment protein [Martelella sp. AMO21009]
MEAKMDDMIPHGALVIVADFSKALIFRNIASGQKPKLDLLQHMDAPPNPAAHEQGTDRPGRVVSDSHRSAVEITNFHELAGQKFIKDVAERAHEIAASEEIDRLVLVAPPRSLAALREALASTEDTGRIVMSVSKDLVNFPVDEIAENLSA